MTRHEWTRNQNEIAMSRSCAQIHREADTARVCEGGGGCSDWLRPSACYVFFICIQHNQCKRFSGEWNINLS